MGHKSYKSRFIVSRFPVATVRVDHLRPSRYWARRATRAEVGGTPRVGVHGLDILGLLWMGTAHDFYPKKGVPAGEDGFRYEIGHDPTNAVLGGVGAGGAGAWPH